MGMCISCANYGDKELSLLEQKIEKKLFSSIMFEESTLLAAINEFKELKANNMLDCNASIMTEIIEAKYYYKQYNQLRNEFKKIQKEHQAIKNIKSYYNSDYPEYFGRSGFAVLCDIKSRGKELIKRLENINIECGKVQYNKQDITELDIKDMYSILLENIELSNNKLVHRLLLQ